MNARILIVSAALLVVSVPFPARAADLAGHVTLASEYIYRGMAMSGGNPALQAGLDLRHESGLFAGVWATTVDLSNAAGRRDAEVDYYLGWRLGDHDRVSATLTALHYTYPRSDGDHRYDYTEFLLGVSIGRHWALEYGYTSDLFGHGGPGRHWQLDADWPLPAGVVIGAGIGSNDLEGIGAPDYLHWDIGASVRVDRLMLDLRWYDNERASDQSLGALVAGDQLVLSLTASFL